MWFSFCVLVLVLGSDVLVLVVVLVQVSWSHHCPWPIMVYSQSIYGDSYEEGVFKTSDGWETYSNSETTANLAHTAMNTVLIRVNCYIIVDQPFDANSEPDQRPSSSVRRMCDHILQSVCHLIIKDYLLTYLLTYKTEPSCSYADCRLIDCPLFTFSLRWYSTWQGTDCAQEGLASLLHWTIWLPPSCSVLHLDSCNYFWSNPTYTPKVYINVTDGRTTYDSNTML